MSLNSEARIRVPFITRRRLVRRFFKNQNHFALKADLGLRSLLPQWRALFSTQHLQADLAAGLTVGCVAIPLSLAIALASGVSPETGLISAIVGGIICALLGGTPLAVTGPAAAMAILISSCVAQYGLAGLLVITVVCGLLQLVTGIIGMGRLIRFVPVPVIAGFTAGIGAIILVGQLANATGISASSSAAPLEAINAIFRSIGDLSYGSLFLALGTAGVTLHLPKLAPKVPSALVAVISFSALAVVAGMSVKLLGAIPNQLPAPRMISFPEGSILPLLGSAFVVYMLASLETLLSSAAVDKLSKGQRHDPDQELIGQGLANIAVSAFGAIPVTGVIARSGLNVQAGAKTRRAAIIHSLFLILAVYMLAPILAYIPIPVLAGILIATACRMLHPRELVDIWHSSRLEACVYGVTFLTILSVDLIAGVQAGIIAAFAIASLRLSQTKAMIHIYSFEGPHRVSIDGPMTFISSAKIEMIRSKIAGLDLDRGIVFDVSAVSTIDVSGAGQFVELLEELAKREVQVAVLGLPEKRRTVFVGLMMPVHISRMFVASEEEAIRLIGSIDERQAFKRLIYGVERFRREIRPTYETLFRQLASGQSPHTLFITCSDSRINPNLITATDPGELFIVRNVGNIIPKCGADQMPAEGAAIEFAIGVLGVQEIIICGHSECGAIKSVMSGMFSSAEARAKFPSIAAWLSDLRDLNQELPITAHLSEAVERNVLKQVANLKTYPIVKERLAQGTIRIHAWFYDLEQADLLGWNDTLGMFVPIDSQNSGQSKSLAPSV